jgi:hypothetical protein
MSNNFQGYLLKFGSTVFPHEYLAQGTVFTPKQRTEAEAYRDANNDLHRVTIDNHKSKLEITTLPITLDQKIEIETAMRAGLQNSVERKYTITYWNDDPESQNSNNYATGSFYLSDVSYTHKRIESGTIHYESVKYTFVEY